MRQIGACPSIKKLPFSSTEYQKLKGHALNWRILNIQFAFFLYMASETSRTFVFTGGKLAHVLNIM